MFRWHSDTPDTAAWRQGSLPPGWEDTHHKQKEIFQDTAQTVARSKHGHNEPLKVDASLVQSNITGNTFTHNTW